MSIGRFQRAAQGAAAAEVVQAVAEGDATGIAQGDQLGQFIERKRAETAALKSEATHAAIMAAALDCIVTMDHEGRIVEFNPAAERMFGYARAEVLGRDLLLDPLDGGGPGGFVLVGGVAGALVSTRYLRSQLFNIEPTDPLTFAAIVLLLVSTALVGAYVPARRAARTSPIEVLRG